MSNKAFGYRRILFASDLASNSRAAFDAALAVASAGGAKLTILHVFDFDEAVPRKRTGDFADLRQLHDDAERRLEAQVRLAEAAGATCVGILDSGAPAEVILETIETKRADLAVLGTNALRGIERMVFGSDAELVLRKSKCPVLVIGPHVPIGKSAAKTGPVVFATDFRPSAVHGMRAALDYANALGAELRCVHVLPPLYAKERHKVIPAMLQEALERLVAEQVGLAAHPLCAVEYGESVPEGVVKFAETAGARAIVLGVRQAGAFAAHAAPGVAFRVIAAAPCPVLTIASSAAAEAATGVAGPRPRALAESCYGDQRDAPRDDGRRGGSRRSSPGAAGRDGPSRCREAGRGS